LVTLGDPFPGAKTVSYAEPVLLLGCLGARQRSEQVVSNVDDMAMSVENAEHQTRRLESSYYALMGWVAAVTAAVIAVTVLTVFRRTRRQTAAARCLDGPTSTVAGSTAPTTIDAVERCSAPVDLTLPSAAELTSASELQSDSSPIICDDRS